MSIAAKRIEKYLAARKKMRQLDQAWIHWINEAELRTEDVSALLDQRAELLEALKRAQQDVNWMTNSGKLLNRFVFDYIDEAITKAEAELSGETNAL